MKRHPRQKKTSLITTLLLAITLVAGLVVRWHTSHVPSPPTTEGRGEWEALDDAFLGQ